MVLENFKTFFDFATCVLTGELGARRIVTPDNGFKQSLIGNLRLMAYERKEEMRGGMQNASHDAADRSFHDR